MDIIKQIADEFKLKIEQVEKTVALIDEGNTIPFIARYRKEETGSLDDTVLRDLDDRLTYLRNIEKRKTEVTALITEMGKMTDEIAAAIANAQTITEVDDIYRPFRPHRKTRASVAKEKGLEPLAELILAQEKKYDPEIEIQAEAYINEELGVSSVEEALNGACDIIAESVSDNADFRKTVRKITFDTGLITTKGATEEDSVYAQYYDYTEPVAKIPSHRILAINRGEKEDFLKASITVEKGIILNYLCSEMITEPKSPSAKYIEAAIIDSYDRLIAPSIEREVRNDLFDTASESAIKLFAENLKHLLMQSPLKGKTVLGFDPGFINGCKTAVVDKTGKVLDTAVVYPTTKSKFKTEEAAKIIKRMVEKHKVDVIAIGNGTASRESEQFIAETLKTVNYDCKYIIISEAGASVYSASKLAAEEFPDFDVMQRSAVSIARRLQDPLAELVKIDPKSIGVGQYQHDMKPARLDGALEGVVEDCVNSVGVDVNTASYSLLSYIAGINVTAAKNIVKYREENGEFKSRNAILKVPSIGAKAFEQCAVFLRVPNSKEILDNTGIHPESYAKAALLIGKFGYTKADIGVSGLKGLRKAADLYGIAKLSKELDVGEPTVIDIITELEKPGRDIRDALPMPELHSDILDISDLSVGMVLNGVVRNVIDFGAFVDIGVHQDGLVHVSEISQKFIRHHSEMLSIGDNVRVKIKTLDIAKKRIGLTMKNL